MKIITNVVRAAVSKIHSRTFTGTSNKSCKEFQVLTVL